MGEKAHDKSIEQGKNDGNRGQNRETTAGMFHLAGEISFQVYQLKKQIMQNVSLK